MPGKIVHTEIPADDIERARGFWGPLFGWEFQSFPGPFEYHMTRIADDAGAALTDMEPGKKGLRCYFDVDDINAGVARVQELGGQAGDVRPIPNMGWFAVCADPHGNDFGLWQNDASAPAEGTT